MALIQRPHGALRRKKDNDPNADCNCCMMTDPPGIGPRHGSGWNRPGGAVHKEANSCS